jgi:hypothetical protein
VKTSTSLITLNVNADACEGVLGDEYKSYFPIYLHAAHDTHKKKTVQKTGKNDAQDFWFIINFLLGFSSPNCQFKKLFHNNTIKNYCFCLTFGIVTSLFLDLCSLFYKLPFVDVKLHSRRDKEIVR